MKTNYVLFVALSFAVLFGWNYATVKNRPPAPPAGPAAAGNPAAVSSPGTAPSAGAVAVGAPAVRRERPVEKEIGIHRIEFNAQGAGVLQWNLGGDVQSPLVLPDAAGEHPFAVFPALSFDEVPSGPGAAFRARDAGGLKVGQSYEIDPRGYLHTLRISLENAGPQALSVPVSLGWGPGINSGNGDSRDRSAEQRALALEGTRLIELKPGAPQGPYSWFGVDARYFLAAFLNEGGAAASLIVEKKDKLFTVRRVENVLLAPGEKRELVQKFYLGPKSHDTLASLGLGLERAVDFGFFSALGRWIHRALISLEEMLGNFGWAIMLLTFFVQVLLSPLTVSSFKHSLKMKALQPQMKRLQEMYKGNPQRLNQEMLALYQRHGLKFMGLEGCLPVLIQMPVFFALYAVLYKTYELRHAPWIGWVTDLSARDPFYVLPLVMGGAMFFQQKILMSASDPTQKQLMYIMPVVFTFIMLKMPSGLVLYWLTQNILSLGLQLILKNRAERAGAPA